MSEDTTNKPKKGRKPKYGYTMSGAERKRKHDDKAVSIDDKMKEAFKKIDWQRRKAAEQSLSMWVKTYCVPLLLNDEPPKLGGCVLDEMQRTITSHENYMICMGRGSGKTSYVECTTLYAIATGTQKYVVVVSNNQRASNGIMQDIWRAIIETDTLFANDYPEVCLPFQVTNGSFRRRQMYNGVTTDIVKNACQLVLPRLVDENGDDMPTSGSVISCRGISSGLRGMKHGKLRPSFCILDDLQTTETASNPVAVDKLIESIHKDIVPLAGKERLSILQTATPVCPDDLVEKIKADKAWKTTVYPAIISYPTNMELWQKYFMMYDEESGNGETHEQSLKYYKDNKDDMDQGAQVFNPTRFSEKDGHISAIQKLLELQHQIGENAFDAEYQMSPKALKFSLPITPEIVASRKSDLPELQLPDSDVQWVCASSDLNLSKYITTTIVAFYRNHTASVIYHTFRKCAIPANIPEQDYYQRVYDLLSKHGQELKKLGIPINGWVIDANGTPYKAVLDFCKNSMRICGLPAAGFIGKASHLYRSFMRTRLKEDVNRTLLCGDEDEHKKAGSGKKYTFFDSDYYHEKVQKGFLQEVGNTGSITLYDGNDHGKWAIQICAEKLMMKKQRGDGTWEYHWKAIGEDHDALDSIGQALAAYGSQGFATGFSGKTAVNAQRMRHAQAKKRLRFV